MKTSNYVSKCSRHVLLAFICLNFLSLISSSTFAQDLEIVNIRVGQGDATLIQGPVADDGSRVNVLVDAGDISGRDGGNILRAVLAKRDVDHLDFMIVSHYDADHIGGIVSGRVHGVGFLFGFNGVPGAIGDDDGDGDVDWIGRVGFQPDPDELGTDDDMTVGNFVDRGDVRPPSSQAYEKYKFMAEAKGNRISINDRADVEAFEIDLGDGAKMTCLAANGFVRERTARVANVNTENERSLSFLLSYKDFDFLISGDLIGQRHGGENAKVEAAVGEFINRQDIIVDVLHVNHHGGNNGSEAQFLADIQPIIAVISAGNGNSHKHPHNSVLKRLDEALVYRIFQTSWGTTEAKIPLPVRKIHAVYQGDIVISSDGDRFTISTERTFRTDDNPRRP